MIYVNRIEWMECLKMCIYFEKKPVAYEINFEIKEYEAVDNIEL